jgi:hypothetical protein
MKFNQCFIEQQRREIELYFNKEIIEDGGDGENLISLFHG